MTKKHQKYLSEINKLPPNTVIYKTITIPNEFFKSLRKNNPVEKWSKERTDNSKIYK